MDIGRLLAPNSMRGTFLRWFLMARGKAANSGDNKMDSGESQAEGMEVPVVVDGLMGDSGMEFGLRRRVRVKRG